MVQHEGAKMVEVVRIGSQPSVKGKADYFTGSVRIDPLFDAAAPSRTVKPTGSDLVRVPVSCVQPRQEPPGG